MTLPSALINELETAALGSAPEKRASTLHCVTDLFLSGADHFNAEQIDLFDDVLSHLIKRVEIKALAELSRRLAPTPYAPIGVVRQLARHSDILVAGPVLSQSERQPRTRTGQGGLRQTHAGHGPKISGFLASPARDIAALIGIPALARGVLAKVKARDTTSDILR